MGLEIEVCFAPIRENQPLFHDINKFVTECGFQLFDIKRYYWRRLNTLQNYGKGQLIFGDALYFRSPESICRLSEINESKIIAGLLLFLSYGYLDQARTLYILAKERKIISADIFKELEALFAKYRRKMVIPDFKGKQRIANIFSRIASIFYTNRWDTGDGEFGN